ncbi:MAG: DNA polymerase II [Pontibacterium sp.]
MEGVLLTRDQRDVRGQIQLSYWLKTANGPERVVIERKEAVFFVPQSHEAEVESRLYHLRGWRLEPLPLKTFDQTPVLALYTDTLKTQRAVIKALEEAGVPLHEEDIRPADRYLMERFIFSGAAYDPDQPNRGLTPSSVDVPIQALSLDIETTLRNPQLLSVGLYAQSVRVSERQYHKVLMIRSQGSQPQDTSELSYLEYVDNEYELLTRLQDEINKLDPDMLIGWNVIGFDMRVLAQRAKALGHPFAIARDGTGLRLHQSGQGQTFARITGRLVVDGIDALKGATFHFDRYGLEFVAQTFLGHGKAIDKVEDRGERIQQLYREEPVALAKYNLEDCRLVWQIFEKADLINYLQERARLTGLSLDKVGGSAAAFDYVYLPPMHRAGYVAPVFASGADGLDAPGGFVMESQPGLFNHVLVLDFKSLYPSIIRSFRIDPVGLAEGTKSDADEANLVPGFNHAIFDRDKALLPKMIEDLWAARDRAKAKNNEALSRAIKIIMNSFYGVLGSNVCRFYDQRLSSSITLRGHEILNKTKQAIEETFGFKVIYGDTDSVFVWLGDDFDEEKVDAQGKALAVYLNDWWQQQLDSRFGLPCALELEYETHYRRFLMPTIRDSDKGSKKRYAGVKRSPSGDEKLVFKGLENVRTDWTPLARSFQEQLYSRVFYDQPWQQLVQDTVDGINRGQCDDQLVYRKRLRRDLDTYTKNRPPQVQAALKLQAYWQKLGRPQAITAGETIAYVMTTKGAEPVENICSPLDYQHYIDKQIKPVADSILGFLGERFDDLVAPQIKLF